MRLIDLSHVLAPGLPPFPGDPKLEIQPHSTVEANRVNVSRISMGSHQGTHLDAFYHFVPTGRRIHEMPLEWFYGPAHRISIPKEAGEDIDVDDFRAFEHLLQPGARIVFHTGWERNWGTQAFFEDFPSVTQEAAQYLADKGIRLLGMDTPTPSRDWYEVHHILLGAEVVVVESLANLADVPDRFTLAAFPLRFKDLDGSPIRAVAIVE